MRIFLLLMFLISTPAMATQRYCETDKGSRLPFEEFTDYNKAVLFAKGMGLDDNIIKEKDEERYMVFMILPDIDEICIALVEE